MSVSITKMGPLYAVTYNRRVRYYRRKPTWLMLGATVRLHDELA